MNIRPKVTALVASLFVVLGVAEILVIKRILLPSFVELERTDAHIAMRRIRNAVEQMTGSPCPRRTGATGLTPIDSSRITTTPT